MIFHLMLIISNRIIFHKGEEVKKTREGDSVPKYHDVKEQKQRVFWTFTTVR